MRALLLYLLATFVIVDAFEQPILPRAITGNAPGLGGSRVATAWYAGWHAEDFPLTNVSWSKYTQLTYAFAETTSDVTVVSLADSDEELIPQFVAAAHKNGVKASLSIGGWTGSRWFSSNVGSDENRTAFVQTVTNLARKYKLDGIDFDWEYPASQGIGCNVVGTNDTANFLAFLQELRQDSLGANLTLSAATAITPFMDSSGNPSTDVSEFSKVLDFIEVMVYDVWGSWSSGVGPNAPLNDSCAPSVDQQGSAVSAVKAWSDAGMPNNQIVLGVASYGHSFSVKKTAALQSGSSSSNLASYPAFDANNQPTGDAWDDGAGEADVCGVVQGPAGVFDFWGLIAGGFLNADGSVASGIDYRFDSCSQTPYVYNSTSQVMVSYDNVQSFAAKGSFIASDGLRGFAMWEAGGDSNDILLDSILAATASGVQSSNPESTTSSAASSAGTDAAATTKQPSSSSQDISLTSIATKLFLPSSLLVTVLIWC